MSKRSYHESFMKFGFTSIVNNGTVYLVCYLQENISK